MEGVYNSPNSELSESKGLELTFGSLGIWRKIYVCLNWIAAAFVSIGAGYVIFGDEKFEYGPGVMLLMITIFLAYTYWMHVAISKRKIDQLLVLALIQIVPFFNPISCLIFFAIRSTSKKEIGAN